MGLPVAMRALVGAIFTATAMPSGAAAAWPERTITLVHGFGAAAARILHQ